MNRNFKMKVTSGFKRMTMRARQWLKASIICPGIHFICLQKGERGEGWHRSRKKDGLNKQSKICHKMLGRRPYLVSWATELFFWRNETQRSPLYPLHCYFSWIASIFYVHKTHQKTSICATFTYFNFV